MTSVSSPFWYVWEFCKLHPGIVLVLFGVIGEVGCDWKEMGGRLARAKKLSAVLLIIGLVLEFWDAAKSDNEVRALSQKIAKIDPLNVPIHSMRAVVYLLVRGDFSNDPTFFPNRTITKGAGNIPIQGDLPTLNTMFVINGKGGAWLILDCDKDESELSRIPGPGETTAGPVNARRFNMVFNWPGPIMTSPEPSPAFRRFWIDRKNISTSELDKDGISASVMFFGFTKGMEVMEGSCDVTINGEIPRHFSNPKISDSFSVDFSTMEGGSP
jgi:hypothetical protein